MTSIRDKIIRYYKASDDDSLASRLIDIAESAIKTRKYKLSDFLDPHAASVAQTVAAHFDGIKVDFDGGFKNAERVRAAFFHEDYMGGINYDIVPISVKWDKRFYNLSHKDVLGAIMGVGCEREVVGDIVFTDDGAQFVVTKTIAEFFLANLTDIGAANVSCDVITLEELAQKEEKVKEIKATVAALRLDAVAAAGYGVSRSRMAEEIKSQRVKVNWKEAKNAAQPVNEGDTISFRSRGRLEVAEIKGQTKKGRISVVLRRYI